MPRRLLWDFSNLCTFGFTVLSAFVFSPAARRKVLLVDIGPHFAEISQYQIVFVFVDGVPFQVYGCQGRDVSSVGVLL